jgi:hypothetical protein
MAGCAMPGPLGGGDIDRFFRKGAANFSHELPSRDLGLNNPGGAAGPRLDSYRGDTLISLPFLIGRNEETSARRLPGPCWLRRRQCIRCD